MKSLDWANVMSYDYNVPGGRLPRTTRCSLPDPRDPNANDPTWNTLGTVAWYLLNGVPASKIVVGVPFYANQYIRNDGRPLQAVRQHRPGRDQLGWHLSPQPTYHDLVDGGHADRGRRGAERLHAYVERTGGRAVSDQPGGHRTLANGQRTRRHDDRVLGPEVDRRAYGADQGARPAGRDGWEISQDSNDHALISALAPVLH